MEHAQRNRIDELEDELKQRMRQIEELKSERDAADKLVAEQNEHIEDASRSGHSRRDQPQPPHRPHDRGEVRRTDRATLARLQRIAPDKFVEARERMSKKLRGSLPSRINADRNRGADLRKAAKGLLKRS